MQSVSTSALAVALFVFLDAFVSLSDAVRDSAAAAASSGSSPSLKGESDVERLRPSEAVHVSLIANQSLSSGTQFDLNVHGDVTGEACKYHFGSGTKTFLPGQDARDRLHAIFGSTWGTDICQNLNYGTAWPDCPTIGDTYTLRNACFMGVPMHQGMFEMARQFAWAKLRWMWWKKGDFAAYTTGTFRAGEQHKHASPLLPLHIDNGKQHLAVVNHRQLQSKMIDQSAQWVCKSAHMIGDAVRTKDRERMEIGVMFFGKILHLVQDSFSLSHAKREIDTAQRNVVQGARGDGGDPVGSKAAELLAQLKIVQVYSMDDVDWSRHAELDKGGKMKEKNVDGKVSLTSADGLNGAAVLASSQVLTPFANFLNRALHNGDVHESLRQKLLEQTGEALCSIWSFKDEKAGAGGSFEGLGLNGKDSDWTAAMPSTAEDKKKVKEAFEKLVKEVDEERKAGRTALDMNIQFTYRGQDEESLCALLKKNPKQLTCKSIGVTADLATSPELDYSWGFNLSYKPWFFLWSSVFLALLVSCCVSCCLRQRRSRDRS